jgi:hypothetical protein
MSNTINWTNQLADRTLKSDRGDNRDAHIHHKEEHPMRPIQVLSKSAIIVVVTVMVGCAGHLTEGIGPAPAAVQAEFVSQSDARDLAFKYRREAADLREMARRLEAEVQWLTDHVGSTDEQIRRSRETARQLWAAADQAEQLARDYRRQVPHGQVN